MYVGYAKKAVENMHAAWHLEEERSADEAMSLQAYKHWQVAMMTRRWRRYRKRAVAARRSTSANALHSLSMLRLLFSTAGVT